MIDPPAGFMRAEAGRAQISREALEEALAVAHLACDRAREEILPRYRKVRVETKGDGSPVTEADRAAERAIRAVIREHFPEDALLGEEFGAEDGATADATSGRRWIIDPIDGTIAFARGIPLFTTLIALAVDGEPVLGIIDLPAVNDRIGGFRDGGVFRGEERVSVTSQELPLEKALVSHGDLDCFDLAGLRPLFQALCDRISQLRGYTDAFGHLLVLTGAADAMVDCDLNPWDAAVTRVLAREAGGECWVREREDGRKIDLIFGSLTAVQAIGKLVLTRNHSAQVRTNELLPPRLTHAGPPPRDPRAMFRRLRFRPSLRQIGRGRDDDLSGPNAPSKRGAPQKKPLNLRSASPPFLRKRGPCMENAR